MSEQLGGANEQCGGRKFAAERDALTLLFWQHVGLLLLFGAFWPIRESVSGARDSVVFMLTGIIVISLMIWLGFERIERKQ